MHCFGVKNMISKSVRLQYRFRNTYYTRSQESDLFFYNQIYFSFISDLFQRSSRTIYQPPERVIRTVTCLPILTLKLVTVPYNSSPPTPDPHTKTSWNNCSMDINFHLFLEIIIRMQLIFLLPTTNFSENPISCYLIWLHIFQR